MPDATPPDAAAPEAITPGAVAPQAVTPDAAAPQAITPDAVAPEAVSPDALRPEEVRIEPATPDDREWAARVMAASDPWVTLGRGLDQCRARCLDPDYEVLVARHGNERCAFAVLHPRGVAGSPYLASFAVEPAWRSRGVGAILLDACERRFAASSRHFFLCVSSFNTRARAFYERHGFRQVGEFPGYVIEGASEILLHKRLEPR